jgi:beta-lactamase class A
VRLGGIEINGATRTEVIEGLNRQFGEPVALYYGDQRILLRPQAVGFQVDADAMLQDAKAYDTFLHLVRYLGGRALNRLPAPVDVPLRYTVDQVALDNWLADVGRRYDRKPGPPQPILDTLTIAPGKPGQQLELAASRERVIIALTDPQNRTGHLAVRETPPLPIDMNALAELLRARLEQFPGIASVYLHHIPTGEEVAINADVAYAGMSTIKLITETTSLSGNFTANLLLGIIDDGSSDSGVRILNDSLHKLGLDNTFMATPYDRKNVTPPRIVTKANSRTDLNTQPDPYMQTTPRDMGTMLQMLVECSQGGGTFLAAYPDQYTTSECQQALDFLALNEVKALITSGVPEGTRVVHKHGYVADTHGDVAAIWGPDGPYILSVFLYRPPWLEWQLSDGTMREISQAVWNYFEMARASRN